MPKSIESFVKKLQIEGIEAGKKAAEKIKKTAMQEKEKILADAKADAEKIILEAKSHAEKQLFIVQNELELAVRDAILKLGESVGDLLSAILLRGVERKLFEPDYIGDIMREVITAYAKADAGQTSRMEIHISKKMRDKLKADLFEDLFRDLHKNPGQLPIQFTLPTAGFEYSIHGSTVEVSPESVAELLAEMVEEDLSEIINKIAKKV